MAAYDVPGVYVEEVSTGAKPIGAASTSVPALVGLAPRSDRFVNEPRACNYWSEFVRDFMDEDSKGTNLAQAVYGFFQNGGRRCYVLNIGSHGSVAGDARKRTGILALEPFDEPSMIAAPGYTTPGDHRALLDFAENFQRFAILDVPERVEDVKELTEVGSEESAVDVEAAKKPRAKASRPPDSKYGACYYPSLVVKDPFSPGNVTVPPSGHIAGIYAANDFSRGVHKAPANVPVRGACGLSHRLTRAEQGVLNMAGVNAIAFFKDAGIRIWGARTLSITDPEWRYVNVRRLFNMIEDSIGSGTRWVVFEPNDQSTRNSVARDCRAFLTLQWRSGALVGKTPDEAFFVKCDEENNPTDVVDAGRLVVDIGVAPSKPAEFVIFRIGQWQGSTDVQAA